jgi:acyl carrier protein
VVVRTHQGVEMLMNTRRKFMAQTGKSLLLLIVTISLCGQVGAKSKSKQCGGVVLRSTVEKKIRAIVVEQLGVDPEKVIAKARFVDDLGADSLDAVELVMSFEDAFDIEIPDRDAEKIVTVQDAVDYICSHVKARK